MLQFSEGNLVYLRYRNQIHGLQMGAQPKIYKVLAATPNGAVKLQRRDGRTMATNVKNCAPCHIPTVDTTIQLSVIRDMYDNDEYILMD
eukprot:737-Pelagomonas_calceolata.AAC.5